MKIVIGGFKGALDGVVLCQRGKQGAIYGAVDRRGGFQKCLFGVGHCFFDNAGNGGWRKFLAVNHNCGWVCAKLSWEGFLNESVFEVGVYCQR